MYVPQTIVNRNEEAVGEISGCESSCQRHYSIVRSSDSFQVHELQGGGTPTAQATLHPAS